MPTGNMVFHTSGALPPLSFPGTQMVLDDHYAHLSGIIATDLPGADGALGDVRAETRLVMEAVCTLLSEVGLTLADAVRVDVHLADIADADAMDEVYGSYFDVARYPARTCTESPRLCGGARVEITIMARRR